MHKLQPKSFFVGQNHIFLPHCHSTNDDAMRIGQNGGFFNGLVITTDYQDRGRGQRGTHWESEPGQNLMMSILIDTSFLNLNNSFELSMAASLGVASAIREFIISDVKIKWPNDIFLDNEKLAGILIENSIKGNKLNFSVIGIGVNVNQTYFLREGATSLFNKGVKITPDELAEKICEHFEQTYLKIKNGVDLKEDYMRCLLGFHKKMKFLVAEEEIEGIIVDITSNGLLKLETISGLKTFDIKEIKFCI